MVALGMICIISIVPGIDAPRVLAWGLPALLIVGGVLSLSAFIPRLVVPTALGDASYSIYLTHTFVVSALAKVMPANASLIFAALLGSSAVGLCVHLLLERPVQRIMTRRRARLRSKPISGQTHVSVEPYREAQVGQDVR
jgi:exopolysaccharide production protein ExoZ